MAVLSAGITLTSFADCNLDKNIKMGNDDLKQNSVEMMNTNE